MDKGGGIEGAIIGALATVTAGLLALIGVLWNANRNFRLGLTVEHNKTEAQQQTADEARISQLVTENEGLRKEINTIWESLKSLRRDFDAETEQHRKEKTALEEENADLRDQLRAKDKEIGSKNREIKAKDRELSAKDREIDRLNAECETALRAQERVEGGLASARQIITDICPATSQEACDDSRLP